VQKWLPVTCRSRIAIRYLARALIYPEEMMEQGTSIALPKHDSHSRRVSDFPRIHITCGFAAIALAALLSDCARGATDVHSIVIDRQVLLGEIGGTPNAITQMPDGGFVVVGVRGIAWAVGTDAKGTMLWKYEEPIDDKIKSPFQSHFNDVVPLANGRVLACGESTIGRSVALVTILDSKGHLVDRRLELPSTDSTLTSSGFHHCLRWGSGIALIGYANDGKKGYSWIEKLNDSGQKVSQFLVKDTGVRKTSETAEGSFVLPFFGGGQFEMGLLRADSAGDVLATRTIKGFSFLTLKSYAPTTKTNIISYGIDNKATLYTLNDRLADAEPPKQIGDFDTSQGSGYVLPDNSLVLLGRTQNAAVAWIGSSGQMLASMTFGTDIKSFATKEAVPLSTNQLVTVLDSVSGTNHGVVMTWVTLR
jgi:hypothetical protein